MLVAARSSRKLVFFRRSWRFSPRKQLFLVILPTFFEELAGPCIKEIEFPGDPSRGFLAHIHSDRYELLRSPRTALCVLRRGAC